MTTNLTTCNDEPLSAHKLAQLQTLTDDLEDQGALSYASTLLLASGEDGISRLSYAEMEPMLGSRIAVRGEHTLTVGGVLVAQGPGKPKVRVGGEERLVEERQYHHARSQAIRRACAVLDERGFLSLGAKELDEVRRRNPSTGAVWERPREKTLVVEESDKPWRWQGAPAWLLQVLLDDTMRPITGKVALRLCGSLDASGTVVDKIGSTALSREELHELWGVYRDVIVRVGETKRTTPTCLDELRALGLIDVVEVEPPADGKKRHARRWTITARPQRHAQAPAHTADSQAAALARVADELPDTDDGHAVRTPEPPVALDDEVEPRDDDWHGYVETAGSVEDNSAEADELPTAGQLEDDDDDAPFVMYEEIEDVEGAPVQPDVERVPTVSAEEDDDAPFNGPRPPHVSMCDIDWSGAALPPVERVPTVWATDPDAPFNPRPSKAVPELAAELAPVERVYIEVQSDQFHPEWIGELRELCSRHPGPKPVWCEVASHDTPGTIVCRSYPLRTGPSGEQITVTESDAFWAAVRQLQEPDAADAATDETSTDGQLVLLAAPDTDSPDATEPEPACDVPTAPACTAPDAVRAPATASKCAAPREPDAVIDTQADGHALVVEAPQPTPVTVPATAAPAASDGPYTIRVGVPHDGVLAMLLASAIRRDCREGDAEVAVGWADGVLPLEDGRGAVCVYSRDTMPRPGKRPAIEAAVHSTLYQWQALPADVAA